MASENQRRLANIIKNVHQTLRINSRKMGDDKAWLEHCGKVEVLKEYAQAMQQLAIEYWDKNADDVDNTKARSRVEWVVKKCEEYYVSGGIYKAFGKEVAMCTRYNLKADSIMDNCDFLCCEPKRLKVLDVGSCYNPFRKFPIFDVIAVDLAPASKDVYICDFLNVEVLEEGLCPTESSDNRITELPAASFDVVIFSLLLEYLPSSKQRFLSCRKASRLLKPGGILCIVTPDSKHATANAQIMKKWKYALAHEDLMRIDYDKLPHLHCMVFRKCVNPSLANLWLSNSLTMEVKRGRSFSDNPEELMVIPQDFHSYSEKKDEGNLSVREDDQSIALMFEDLPDL